MGRRKIEIQAIRNEKNRNITFAKRKDGLFKKVKELGTLCCCKAIVIVFFDGKLYKITSSDDQIPFLFEEYVNTISISDSPIPLELEYQDNYNSLMGDLWVLFNIF